MIACMDTGEWVEHPLAGALWVYRRDSDPVVVVCPPWMAQRTLDDAIDAPVPGWVREMMTRARAGDYRIEEW